MPEPKGEERQKQKPKRESRCNFDVVFKDRGGNVCYIMSKPLPTNMHQQPTNRANGRTNALMSESFTPNRNVHHVIKDEKYRISGAVFQNEIITRNILYEPL